MRRRRLTVYLTLLFLLPAALSIFIGIKLAGDEQQMQRVQQRELVSGRLSLLKVEVERFLRDYNLRITATLEELKSNPSQVREIRRRNAYVDQMFIVDRNGMLDFPSFKYAPLSNAEKVFVEQTRLIWEDKLVIQARNRDEIINRRAKTYISLKGAKRTYDEGIRWLSYFKPEGQALLAFLSNRHKGYWGADVSMSRLKAEIIQWLPEDLGYELKEGEYVALNTADGKPMYFWGNVPDKGSFKVRDKIELPAPLDAWSINFHASNAAWSKVPSSSVFNVVSGIALFLLVFLLAGFAYYRLQKRELIEAQQRVSFVNQVSHELKTPLTTIRMYAELLEDKLDEEDEASRDKLRVITRESERLSRLILNILTFGKKEAQKLEIRPAACLPAEVVTEVVAQHQERLAAKEINVVLELSPMAKHMLDRDALVQILSNLLSNVEKYATDASQVVVTAAKDDDGLVFMVVDDGPGVAIAERERIFEAFYRSDAGLTQAVSGSGIGLHISRELARRHGGDLKVIDSEKGACFELKLKAEEVERTA